MIRTTHKFGSIMLAVLAAASCSVDHGGRGPVGGSAESNPATDAQSDDSVINGPGKDCYLAGRPASITGTNLAFNLDGHIDKGPRPSDCPDPHTYLAERVHCSLLESGGKLRFYCAGENRDQSGAFVRVKSLPDGTTINWQRPLVQTEGLAWTELDDGIQCSQPDSLSRDEGLVFFCDGIPASSNGVALRTTLTVKPKTTAAKQLEGKAAFRTIAWDQPQLFSEGLLDSQSPVPLMHLSAPDIVTGDRVFTSVTTSWNKTFDGKPDNSASRSEIRMRILHNGTWSDEKLVFQTKDVNASGYGFSIPNVPVIGAVKSAIHSGNIVVVLSYSAGDASLHHIDVLYFDAKSQKWSEVTRLTDGKRGETVPEQFAHIAMDGPKSAVLISYSYSDSNMRQSPLVYQFKDGFWLAPTPLLPSATVLGMSDLAIARTGEIAFASALQSDGASTDSSLRSSRYGIWTLSGGEWKMSTVEINRGGGIGFAPPRLFTTDKGSFALLGMSCDQKGGKLYRSADNWDPSRSVDVPDAYAYLCANSEKGNPASPYFAVNGDGRGMAVYQNHFEMYVLDFDLEGTFGTPQRLGRFVDVTRLRSAINRRGDVVITFQRKLSTTDQQYFALARIGYKGSYTMPKGLFPTLGPAVSPILALGDSGDVSFFTEYVRRELVESNYSQMPSGEKTVIKGLSLTTGSAPE